MAEVLFFVSIQLDPDVIDREAVRRGYSLERGHEAVLADLENRLHDAIRFRDAVTSVGVALGREAVQP